MQEMTTETIRAAVKKLRENAVKPEPCGCVVLKEANAVLTCDEHSEN